MPFRSDPFNIHIGKPQNTRSAYKSGQDHTKIRHSGSKPKIFPPPQVDGQQIHIKENKKEEEETFNLEQTSNSDQPTKTNQNDNILPLHQDINSHKESSISEFELEPKAMKEDFVENEVSPHHKALSPLAENFSGWLEGRQTSDSSVKGESLSPDEQNNTEKIPKKEKKNDQKSLAPKSSFSKENSKIVKLPVLLSNLDFEIEIFDSFKLFVPLENILKMEWSMQSLDVQLPLTSTTVFLKGELVATIEYVSKNSAYSLHSVKIPISWCKPINVTWLASPIVSGIQQKEFIFQDEKGISSHYEYEQHYAEKIQYALRHISFVSHNELNSHLSIKGIAKVAVDLLQSQYVNLYSNNSVSS